MAGFGGSPGMALLGGLMQGLNQADATKREARRQDVLNRQSEQYIKESDNRMAREEAEAKRRIQNDIREQQEALKEQEKAAKEAERVAAQRAERIGFWAPKVVENMGITLDEAVALLEQEDPSNWREYTGVLTPEEKLQLRRDRATLTGTNLDNERDRIRNESEGRENDQAALLQIFSQSDQANRLIAAAAQGDEAFQSEYQKIRNQSPAPDVVDAFVRGMPGGIPKAPREQDPNSIGGREEDAIEVQAKNRAVSMVQGFLQQNPPDLTNLNEKRGDTAEAREAAARIVAINAAIQQVEGRMGNLGSNPRQQYAAQYLLAELRALLEAAEENAPVIKR